MDDSPLSQRLRSLVEQGHEAPEVDYKQAMSWRTMTDAEKSELARDMMAMGNAEEPGWIIIGIAEATAGGWDHQGLSADAIRSFDPSAFGPYVNHRADPEVAFTCHETEIDGRRYLGIRVLPFTRLPHICRAGSGKLSEGSIYVRTEAAQTVVVRTAEQMRKLVERAVQIHADEMIRRIESLYELVRGPALPSSGAPPTGPFEDQVARRLEAEP